MHRSTAALATLLLTLAACSGADQPDDAAPPTTDDRSASPTPVPTDEPTTPSPTDAPTPSPSPTTTDEDADAVLDVCTAERFTIAYPATWRTNEPSGILDACRVFHPTAIDLPDQAQEIGFQWAVTLFVDAVPFEDAAGATTGAIIDERRTTVDGRDALVTEVRGTGSTLLPEGERQYGYAVDLDGETLFARTTTIGDTDYDRDREVLDRMLAELVVVDVDPLAGPASTDRSTGEHTGAPIVLTDVAVAGYETFDRITLPTGGDGQPGWDVAYEESPRSQGSGAPVEVDGGATLRISLTGSALPPDAPVAPYDGPERITPTGTEVVLELLDDTVFEGRHDLFVGVDRERPFRVATRDGAVVVELLHE